MKSHIIITGGAQGIGKTTTIELLKKNYCVSVLDQDEEAIEELKLEVDSEHCSLYKVDVSNEAEVALAINETIKLYGNIYGLINNAAISINKPITDLTLTEWQQVINCNLTGTFLCSKFALPYLKKTKGCFGAAG